MISTISFDYTPFPNKHRTPTVVPIASVVSPAKLPIPTIGSRTSALVPTSGIATISNMQELHQENENSLQQTIRSGGILSPTNHRRFNLWFLASFSAFSLLLHLLPISRYYHNQLFSANVFSLIGGTLIILIFPYRLFLKYGETFSNILHQFGLSYWINANIYTFHLVVWILHAIPVAVLFYYKFSLGNPIRWMLLYLVFIFSGQYVVAIPKSRMLIEDIYNMNRMELGFITISTSIVCMGVYMGVYNRSLKLSGVCKTMRLKFGL